MVDYKRVLQLAAAGVSQRGIADALSCSRNTVATVLAAAKTAGIAYDAVADLDPAEVRARLLPPREPKESTFTEPDFSHVHGELARPGVTLHLVWSEYAAKARGEGGVPFGYSAFAARYRKWVAGTGATMRLVRKPGESIEVDWAGETMKFLDPVDGSTRAAYLFVAVLPYSALMFVEACRDMSLGSWIDAHVRAFEFFGGTARILVPDNLRASVSKADRYEPALNSAYSAMAEHYGTVVIPARVRRPRDKSLAENGVRFGANAISAVLRDRTFIGLPELNEAITEELERINSRPFQKREGSRRSVFLLDERPLLNPLPPVPFELAELRKARPGPNYHVQVDGNFYSVPHRLIGHTLDVRLTSRMVEVYEPDGTRVASHARLRGSRNRYQTEEAHMPEAHRAAAEAWSPGRFMNWAATIGPATTAVIESILGSKKIVEQAYRSCLGVMSLAKKDGGPTRLEQSCARALTLDPNPSYTMVKRVWAAWQPTPAASGGHSIADAGFVRGADYYKETTT